MLQRERDEKREDLEGNEIGDRVGDRRQDQHRRRGHEDQADHQAHGTGEERTSVAGGGMGRSHDGQRRSRSHVPHHERQRVESDRAEQTQEGVTEEG